MCLRISKSKSSEEIESTYISYFFANDLSKNSQKSLIRINLDSLSEEKLQGFPRSSLMCNLPNDELFCKEDNDPSKQPNSYVYVIKNDNSVKRYKWRTDCLKSCAIYTDGGIYVFGGLGTKGPLNIAEKFNIKTEK